MSKFVNLQPIWEIATQFIFMIVCKKIFMILAISPPVLPTTTTLNWQFSFSSLKSTKYEMRGTKVSAFLLFASCFGQSYGGSLSWNSTTGIAKILGESSAHNTSRWSYIYLVSLSAFLKSSKLGNSNIFHASQLNFCLKNILKIH